MNSPSDILGISSDSTMEQVETAFQEKSEYWRRLQANPQRSTEAAAMLEQVMVAYETLRAQHQSAAGGLEFREPRVFSGQAGAAPVDKDCCPHCGHKGNPPDARFCLGCGDKLFQVCPNPSCQAELPWHYERCHKCGADIEQTRQEQTQQQRRERERKLEAINQEIASLAAVQSRIGSLGWWASSNDELGQWARKESAGGGCGVIVLAGVIVGLFMVGMVVVVYRSGGNELNAMCWGIMGWIVITSLVYAYTTVKTNKPLALNAIAEERMRLERERRELTETQR